MAWQLLAMWIIVVATVIWFIRDEKRLRAEAELARAARYYAHAPKYRHIRAEEPAAAPVPQPRRVGGLTPEQRALFENLAAARPVPNRQA